MTNHAGLKDESVKNQVTVNPSLLPVR